MGDGLFRLSLVIFLSSLLVGSVEGQDPRSVGVLYTGDPYPGVTPYQSMLEDPAVWVTPVQGSQHHYAGITWQDIYKSLRVYMPRTYDSYVEKYDVVILSDTNRRIFTPDQHFWLSNGVLEEGMGLLMVGGYETFGAGFGHESWLGTPTEEILPVIIPQGDPDWVSGNMPIEVTEEGLENEFIASLPYEERPEYMRIGTDGNYVTQKEGSTLLARWISTKYENPPCYVTWDIGEGRTYAMCHDWTPGGGWVMSRWAYYRDYSVNLMMYLAQQDLPEDHLVVHQYRELIHTLAVGKSTLFSLMEFVESFGGNAREIEEAIIDLEDLVGDSKESYLDHDYVEALARAEESQERMKAIEELALEIKDEALFWVYLIEWLSVSGVAIVSGVFLWSLMIRRRMYREVKTTRGVSK